MDFRRFLVSTLHFHLSTPKPDAPTATDQPDASTKPAEPKPTEPKPTEPKPPEPDPAEIWKKDFQCQWYKTADGDSSYQQPPKDGAPAGVKQSSGDVATGSTTAASAGVASVTKGASATDPRASALPGSASLKPSLEVLTDVGAASRCGPSLTALLLLTAALLLEP